MRAIHLPRLEAREKLRPVVYHLKGILEAQSRIAALVDRLDQVIDENDRETADLLARLEVEIYHQLDYHASTLKEPFEQLVAKVNAALKRGS
jgi:16S rRNA C1402 (ribose-2'-O) methylase RsmI